MTAAAPPVAAGPPRWLAHILATVAIACVVVTLATVARSGDWRGLFLDEPVAGAVLTALGWRLATRLRSNAIGWLLLAGGLGGALAAVANLFMLGAGAIPAPAMRLTAVLGGTLWMLPFAVLPQVLVLFPDGRVATRWHRLASILAGVGALSVLAGFAYPALVLPLSTSLAEADFDPSPLVLTLVLGGAAVFATGLLGTLVAVALRFRGSRGEQRQQMRWLAAAGALTVVLLLVSIGLSIAFPEQVDVLWTLTLLALPIAIAVAVSRYRLWDLDRLISRTLSYALVSGALVSVYLGVVTAAGAMFGRSPLAVASATLAAAAAFGPLRSRVQAVVDRRFHRAQYDAARLVESYRNRLRDRVDLDEVLGDLTATARETMSPASLSVWLQPPRGGS